MSSALMIGACTAVGATYHYLGDFETARQYYTRALQIWRSGECTISVSRGRRATCRLSFP